MHDPLKVVNQIGLSTISQMRMVLQVKNDTPFVNWKQPDFEDAMEKIIGIPIKCSSRQESKYMMMYLIQDLIILAKRGQVADNQDIVSHAWKSWNTFKAENKISLMMEEDYVPIDEDETSVKVRKGSKSEKAYQIYCEYVNDDNGRAKIIEAYKSELDMSPGGATTYFHNMKKRYTQEHN